MDLHLTERRESDEIQDRVSRICKEQIIPALSKICDELSPEQGRLLVNKLELDIGIITAQNMEYELPERLYSKLKEEIKKLKLTPMFGSDASVPQSVLQIDDEEAVRGRLGLLIHFFHHGTVPWWNPYPNRDLNQWIRRQITEDKKAFFTAVGTEIGSPAFRRRVVRYFSDRQFKLFFRYYKLDDLFQLYMVIKDEFPRANKSAPEIASWEQLRHPFLDRLLEQLWNQRTRSVPENNSTTQNYTSNQKMRALANTIHSLEQSHALDPSIITRVIRNMPTTRSIFSTVEWEKIYNQTGSPRPKNRQKQSKMTTSGQTDSERGQETFIEIQNAGLVLLWTNFNKLFTTLGYVNNTEFISEHTTHRSIHLLYFISTGQVYGEEHDWALNKILCGLPPGSFIPYEIELTDKEKEEAEGMIKASIENWRALKSTSIKGFRDTFLLRDGILSKDINGWRLQIERLSYDILLDKLPWPISVINLPWNNHLVHVQW